ncbi:nikA protein, partial [Shigella flexneri]|uniref:nikA protein n=1 Tax=Shigella flexneri TaxID=623 RepID=UPI00271A3561
DAQKTEKRREFSGQDVGMSDRARSLRHSPPGQGFAPTPRYLGRLQKHLFVEGKRTGDKEYAEVLVAITEYVNALRRDLMGR